MHIGVALLVGREKRDQPTVPRTAQLLQGFSSHGAVIGGESDKFSKPFVVVGCRSRAWHHQQDDQQVQPRSQAAAGGEGLGEHHATTRWHNGKGWIQRARG